MKKPIPKTTRYAPLAALLRSNELAAEHYRRLEARVAILEAAAEGKKAVVRVPAPSREVSE